MFISRFMVQILRTIQNVQEGKRHQKKETYLTVLSLQICVVTNLSPPSCFCLCSFCFWGEVSNSWILNDIGRNSLLGNRKKIAKFLMSTFTCRSTFLYDCNTINETKQQKINKQSAGFSVCTVCLLWRRTLESSSGQSTILPSSPMRICQGKGHASGGKACCHVVVGVLDESYSAKPQE